MARQSHLKLEQPAVGYWHVGRGTGSVLGHKLSLRRGVFGTGAKNPRARGTKE